jgi:hypothetical protein
VRPHTWIATAAPRVACLACNAPAGEVSVLFGASVVSCGQCGALTIVLAPDRFDRQLHAIVTRADLEVIERRWPDPVTRLAYLVTTAPAA